VTTHFPTVRHGPVCSSNPWCWPLFNAQNQHGVLRAMLCRTLYEHLMKIDTSLPQIFQKNAKAVSIRCIIYYALMFEVPS
jgi:hypothetical protein